MAIKRGGVSGNKKQATTDYQSFGLDTDFQPWGSSTTNSGSWGSVDSGSNGWGASNSDSSPWSTPSAPTKRGNRAFSFGKSNDDDFDSGSNWNAQDTYSESDDDFANSFSSSTWGNARSKYGNVRGSRHSGGYGGGYGGGGYGGRGSNRRTKDVFRENVLIGDQVKQTISNVLGYSSSPLKGRGREGAAGILRREANEIRRIFSDVIDSFRLW